jgi:non-specific serine/threonine protein kinase/serine/threonine-protein kinase
MERYQQLKELFQAALECAPAQRAAFLDQACAEDAALRAELESLLAHCERSAGFLETPASPAGLISDETVTVGRRIGPYRILRELGRGGMGAVWLAVRDDEQYQKQVAIKLIRGGAGSDFIVSRFRQERQILAQLTHPHIAGLLDGGATEEGWPYLVMEYVDGQPIDEYCDAHKLATAERLKLFRQVCAAVHYAHQHLVVHRDIKPGNILVTADGVPKLLDFGIAKLLATETTTTGNQTLTVMRMLTPDYASPEQALGQPVTTASDVYSLGVLLYELLTGHRPYRVKSHAPQELARIICEQEPLRPSTAVSRVEEIHHTDGSTGRLTPEMVSATREGQPEKLRRRLAGDLDNIVLMALRKEPPRRYSSVEQFSEDLRRHLAGLPVSARPRTAGYRAAKFIRRHRAGVAATALIALSLVAGMIATVWQARIARAERARAERRFNDVRRLANSFLFEFHDGIKNLPGATPMRELLVRRALEYLDSLAREAGSDTTLQSELATAYERVGDIQGNTYEANFGDTTGALQSYGKSLALRAALVAASPQDTDHQFKLATSYGKLAAMQSTVSDLNGALASYQQAEQILQAVISQHPDHAGARRNLALSRQFIGDTLGEQGRAAEGLEYYRRALPYREEMAAQQPGNPVVRRSLALTLANMSGLLKQTEAKAEAVRLARRSLLIFGELAQAEPNNATAQRELAVAHNRLGEALQSTGEVAPALAAFRQSLTMFESLAATDPVNLQLRRDLALLCRNTGYALAQQSREAESRRLLLRAVGLFETMSAADAVGAMAHNDVLECCDYFARACALLAERSRSPARAKAFWQEARTWYQRALSRAEVMTARGLPHGVTARLVEQLPAKLAACDAALAKFP